MLAETTSAWRTLRAAHGGAHFYSFGVYTAELADYLGLTASTEEGLSSVAEQYLASRRGDLRSMRASLRWSPCDSPLHEHALTLLPESDGLRTEGPDPYDDTHEAEAATALVFEVAVETLQHLDRERLFGSGADRASLVLGIWKGDQSDEERIEYVRLLNPPSVVERFVEELRTGYAAAATIVDTQE